MQCEEKTIRAADGYQLYTQSFEPENPVAALVIFHGYGEHIDRYRHVVAHYYEKGYACYLLDHRGHGRSQGRRGHVMQWREYLDDAECFWNEIVAPKWENGPVWLLGHSMGGLIAASYVLDKKPVLKGLILSSPFFGLKAKVNIAKLIAGQIMSRIVPTLSLKTDIEPALLTHQQEFVREYEEDPHVHKVANARWFTETLKTQEHCLKDASLLETPNLLVVQGGDDQIVDPSVSRAFYDRVAVEDKKFILYEGFYHEVLNETDRERVFVDLDAWLDERV